MIMDSQFMDMGENHLHLLDQINNPALRFFLGAYRTSPCQSLYAETNELSLNLRRKKLFMNNTLKLKSNSNNPTYISIVNQEFAEKFTSKPKSTPHFGLRIKQLFSSPSIHFISVTPFWKYNKPFGLFDIKINNDKSSTTSEFFLTNM